MTTRDMPLPIALFSFGIYTTARAYVKGMRGNMLRHGIRANLAPNREDRKAHLKRLDKRAFGIWRPLTEQSGADVVSVLKVAKVAVCSYVQTERPELKDPPFAIPGEDGQENRRLGVSFVYAQKVKSAMRQGGNLWQAFEQGRLLSEIELHGKRQDVALPVEIEGFFWTGRGRRKLVGAIANNEDMQELVKEAKVVEDMLADIGGKHIEVEVPDHITVAQYGSRRDGMPLSVSQRHHIEVLMKHHFEEAGMTTMALGALMLDNQQPWGNQQD